MTTLITISSILLYIIIAFISGGYVYEKHYKDRMFYMPECLTSGIFWPVLMPIIFAWPIISKAGGFFLSIGFFFANIGTFIANRKQNKIIKTRIKEVSNPAPTKDIELIAAEKEVEEILYSKESFL